MPTVSVRYEQAVYGSFPFWDKGYAVLARSPGCRDEWVADLRAACQRYGERPAGSADAGGLIALRLPSGPWAIIGPCPQGCDDRGRPGALAFHALFLSGGDYRKAGAFPFDLATDLCKDWTAETTSLPSGNLVLDHVPPPEPTPPDDPLARQVAELLARGRRVVLEAPGPIDGLARQVWLALPLRRRARLTLSTWTFALGNRPDLAALPRLTGIALDRSYAVPISMTSPRPGNGVRQPPSTFLLRGRGSGWGGKLAWLGFAFVALAALSLAWTEGGKLVTLPPPKRLAEKTPVETPQPARSEQAAPLTPTQRRRIEEGLIALAEHFGILEPGPSAPYAIMQRLRERLSCSDAPLTLDNLARFPHPDRAAAWHAHILLFRPDRPLPADFAEGPLDWQVRVLAWSFHLDPGHRPAEEVPHFLSESLSLPFATPLAEQNSALNDYARFLRRLPVR